MTPTIATGALLRLSLRQLAAHRARLALTISAVTLGVAFVSGSFVLSDTMSRAFDQLFSSTADGSDLTVRARTHVPEGAGDAEAMGAAMAHRPVAESLVATIRGLQGVESAEGAVNGYALVLDRTGHAVTSDAGTLGASLHIDPTLGSPYTVRSGHLPHGSHEVVLDAATAARAGYATGDTVSILTETGRDSFTLTGTIHVGSSQGSTLAGATLAGFDLPTAQRLLGRPGKVDQIDLRAAADVDPGVLRDDVAAVLPTDVEAVTSAQITGESARAVRKNLSMFTTILVAFAAVSLLVGAFVIWNTFSVLVAQRRREVALLRAVGATRRQVLLGLLAEALGIGLVASFLGLLSGTGVALGLLAVLRASGVDMPTTTPAISARTVAVALAVGVVMTVVAATLPAVAATRVAAVEALRDAGPGSSRISRRRRAAGVMAGLGSMASSAAVIAGHGGGRLAALGALLGFTALVLSGPWLARSVARLADRLSTTPHRNSPRSNSWRLAARNVARAPHRSAATALALSIGLSCVVASTVVASSMKASVADAVRGGNRADVMLKPSGMMGGLTPAVAAALRTQKDQLDIAAVAPLRFASATAYPIQRNNAPQLPTATNVAGIDPTQTARVLDLELDSGDLAALRRGSVLLSSRQATKVGARVGDTVDVLFPETGRRSFTVAGILQRDALIGAGYILDNADFEANVTSRLDSALLVRFDATANQAVAKGAVVTALRQFPDVVVKDQAEFVAEQQAHVDQMLGLVTAMLLLAVIIAVLGIVNTLVLSVLERTRELGLLRAVGGTRQQLRTVVRREAVLMSALGAVCAAALGTSVGAAAARALDGQGITSVTIPYATLLGYVVVAALIGIVAAIGPARRASRVDILRAITVD